MMGEHEEFRLQIATSECNAHKYCCLIKVPFFWMKARCENEEVQGQKILRDTSFCQTMFWTMFNPAASNFK